MLDQAVKTLKANSGTHIRVVGNRSSTEEAGLASERAESVMSKLINEYGVDATQISKEVGTEGNRTVQVFVQ